MDRNIAKTVKDIKELKIQGATNISKTAVSALGLWSSKKIWKIKEINVIGEQLAFARPTEPLAQNCISWLLQQARLKEGKSLISDAQKIINELKVSKEKSVDVGIPLIKNGFTLLTHCHSSSVTAIFKGAKVKGLKFKVFLTETRPRYQGHITANELVKAGINTTLITDSEAAYIVSKEDKIEINLIMVGADDINTDGAAINKVGSYGISLSAKKAKIPFYVVATLLKFTPLPIIIEQRSEGEVWEDRPKNLKITNLAFDKIPSENITAFITEAGLIKPKDMEKTVKKIYPWVFAQKQDTRIRRWIKQIPLL